MPEGTARSPRAERRTRDPARTREAIVSTAEAEFARHGFGGGRVDRIARRARANKRMIYHYFGNKEGLFLAVLERVYGAKRAAERALMVDHGDPISAIRALVEFNFDYCRDHPEFQALLNDENLHRARHLSRSRLIRELYSPAVETLRIVLAEGERQGVYRSDVDPMQLYVTIAGLPYFFFANNPTLSTIFGRALASDAEIARYRRHAVDVVVGYLRAPAGNGRARN
ncbi:MAG: TetR family transcriptional regulator [Alphaproteobacteria bacterium]|nr:TetR family transcriptional regulator [Alphaproteobacteria bacterium]